MSTMTGQLSKLRHLVLESDGLCQNPYNYIPGHLPELKSESCRDRFEKMCKLHRQIESLELRQEDIRRSLERNLYWLNFLNWRYYFSLFQ